MVSFASPPLTRSHVGRIAVFRALVLGDLLCAVPALRALRHAFPRAEITLVGLPWARALVERLDCLDQLLPFPGFPGLSESPPDLPALPAFLATAQAARYDLALQMHGDGRITNPLVAALGARHVAGYFRPGAFCPEPALCIPWPESGHEIDRCLALVAAVGAEPRGRELEFPVHDDDRQRLRALWPAVDERPFLVMHPGAQLASRRWPVQRFAAVAEALGVGGWRIVLTGTPAEAPLAQALQAACSTPLVDLVGRTDLWTLGALIERAALLVSNDTGVSHVAAALGTPSVIVALGGDVHRWAPLDAGRHRVLWHDLPCRPCGHATCPTDHACATAIEPEPVIATAFELLEQHACRETPWPPHRTAACASSPGTFTATTSTT